MVRQGDQTLMIIDIGMLGSKYKMSQNNIKNVSKAK
jgi:hypothetical protein